MQDLKQTTNEEVSEETKGVKLEQLPISIIREKLDKKGIKYKPNHSKKFLIKALLAGEIVEKKKEVKKAPTMKDHERPTSLAIIPNSIKAELDTLAQKGLTWEIDEESCCINFMKDIPTCANLDQSAHNILKTAKEAFGRSKPVEVNHVKDMF